MITGWRRVLLWSIFGACVTCTFVFCLGTDLLTAGLDLDGTYWLFPAAGFSAAAFALWYLKPKLRAWGFFGLLAGTALMLPWIPYDEEKMLVRDIASIHVGMSQEEARSRMSPYYGDPKPEVESDGSLTYVYELDPVLHDPFATVTVKDGRVVDTSVNID